jgi:DNA-directed RNA polymerase subunit N (RpoN/RPB10)
LTLLELVALTQEAPNNSPAMDALGLQRYCCRRMIMTHVDLIEKLLKYGHTLFSVLGCSPLVGGAHSGQKRQGPLPTLLTGGDNTNRYSTEGRQEKKINLAHSQ